MRTRTLFRCGAAGEFVAEKATALGTLLPSLPDINGDGRTEFGYHNMGEFLWKVISLDAGGQPHEVWRYPIASPRPIQVGHLFGLDRMTLVYPREFDTSGRTLYDYDFFDIEADTIADTPRMTWNSTMPGVYLAASQFLVEDLDVDGDDELIIAAPLSRHGGETDRNGEIWIFAGGPDFQIDTPTVVLRDDSPAGREYAVHIGRLDADEYPEIISVSSNGGRIRWGGADLRDFNRPVDREFAGAGQSMQLLDADGDGLSDLLWLDPYLHLSSSGKDPHTRAFDIADADRVFFGHGPPTFVLGPLNDSAGRYDMFGLNEATGRSVDLVFSGAPGGPDSQYDATYSAPADGLSSDLSLWHSQPAGDVDGNGWADALAGDRTADGGAGVAAVLSGGPYIPRDFLPSSAIHDVAFDGYEAALSVWPMPATDVVHIAWRGDLRRTPATFAVYNVLGRHIARGEADGNRGEFIWNCAEQPAGAYLLTVFDRSRTVIASVPIMKR